MKLFHQDFGLINEKQLAYSSIEQMKDYKSNSKKVFFEKIKNSTKEEDRLLNAFYKYYEEQGKTLTKEHIDKSLSDGRLKDILYTMVDCIDGSLYEIKERLCGYFVGEEYNSNYLAFAGEEYYYKDDPITWFSDIKTLKKEIVYLMEKFFEDDEQILALEQYLSDCKCNVLKRYITLMVDGWSQKFIDDEMKVVHKYASKYIALKHSKNENLAHLIIEFEYAFLMVADFIDFVYTRAFKRELKYSQMDGEEKCF
jgi:hypothetical protein